MGQRIYMIQKADKVIFQSRNTKSQENVCSDYLMCVLECPAPACTDCHSSKTKQTPKHDSGGRCRSKES